MEVIPFALRLPLSVFQSVDEAPSSLVMMNPQLSAVLQDTGIVGTITPTKPNQNRFGLVGVN